MQLKVEKMLKLKKVGATLKRNWTISWLFQPVCLGSLIVSLVLPIHIGRESREGVVESSMREMRAGNQAGYGEEYGAE